MQKIINMKSLGLLTWIQSIYWFMKKVQYPVTNKNMQGINSMGLVTPWSNFYLHNWRDKLLPVVFINNVLRSILCVLLLQVLKLMQPTINRNNLGLLTRIQSIYWWRRVKYPVTHKHWKGINPMELGDPGIDSYTNNWRDELLPMAFKNKFWGAPSCTSSSNAETNANNNQQQELSNIGLNPVNILITTSEISSNTQKYAMYHPNGPWSPFFRHPYTQLNRLSVACDVNKPILSSVLHVLLLQLTKPTQTTINRKNLILLTWI